jgi:hypothetical protein
MSKQKTQIESTAKTTVPAQVEHKPAIPEQQVIQRPVMRPAIRTASMGAADPAGSAGNRARAMQGMQGGMGNARLGRSNEAAPSPRPAEMPRVQVQMQAQVSAVRPVAVTPIRPVNSAPAQSARMVMPVAAPVARPMPRAPQVPTPGPRPGATSPRQAAVSGGPAPARTAQTAMPRPAGSVPTPAAGVAARGPAETPTEATQPPPNAAPTAAVDGVPAAPQAPADGAVSAPGEGAAAQTEPVMATETPAGAGRGRGGASLGAPNPRAAIAPAAGAVRQRAAGAGGHPPASTSVGSAQAAAINPTTEQTRGAAAQTVTTLDGAKVEQVQRDSFKQKLRKAIIGATPAPKTEAEAEQVMHNGATNASAGLHGGLASERDAAAGPMQTAVQTEASPSAQHAEPRTELHPEQAGPPPAPVSAAPVVPAPLPPERLDYSSDRGSAEQLMTENKVTTEQLSKGNEPSFGATLEARTAAETHEASAAPNYRQAETGVQAQAQAQAQEALGEGLAGMHGTRGQRVEQVAGQQGETKSKNEAKRQEITESIKKIKDDTQTAVKALLEEMETGATPIFEKGLAQAEKAYADAFEEAKGGIGTWLTTWGDDWTTHITASLAKARQVYLATVDTAIDEVATFVEAKLKAAKDRIAAGRQEVENLVKGLDASVKQFGEEALQKVNTEFDAMGSEVDQHRDGLINKLTEQYKASYERMSAKEQELRDANKSLWQRVYEATVGVIAQIVAFKNMLMGILSKAADAIDLIIADPIGFLGNLVTGVMQGLKNFVGNIGTHLQKGLMDWIFGALAGAGLQIPEKLDLQGIISIALQFLGLTYANFRARAVNIVGEPIVTALETAAEVFKVVMSEGIGGLWRFIKEKLEDLKSMVLDAIMDFIKEKVIMAGITWIIGLLNPASAFFKACKAIYDIIMFFVNRGSQILALVNAVVDSVGAIARGATSVAATMVEGALAKAIPVAIGFLAGLLGLGDPSKPVQELMKKAQAPVNKAIDWVINFAVRAVKKVGSLVGGLFGKKDKDKDKKDDQPELTDPEKAAKLEAGLQALDSAEKPYLRDGEIAREDAENVAVGVRQGHPIFKSIHVIDGGGTWDYEYVVNPRGKRIAGFKGASKEVKAGIARLQALAENQKIPFAYRRGIRAQIDRAKQLHKSGRLEAVEVTLPEKRGRIDFLLRNPKQIVEYKYWTEEYTENNISKLMGQLQRYQSSGLPIVLELGITKTKPIKLDFVQSILKIELEKIGLTFDIGTLEKSEELIIVKILPLNPDRG